jgi:hypothetical protein
VGQLLSNKTMVSESHDVLIIFAFRSGGETGAGVEKLRGTHGADFEGTAKVLRGGGGGGCSCIFGGGNSDKTDKFVLLKGPFCFVFKSDTSNSPLYAINLAEMKTEQKGPVALLQTNLGDTQYELQFAEEEVAKKFCKTASKLAKAGQNDEIRKKLGHAHLLNHTKSVMFAASVANKKIEDQPSAPLSNAEIAQNVPIAAI